MSGPSRFGTVNLIAAATATLKNGTGGGAPSLVQDAAYPMSNVMLNDRAIFWSTGTLPGGAFNLDFNFGSTQSINAIGCHGLRLLAGGAMTSIQAYIQTGAYTPGGAWTSKGMLAASSPAQRDWGVAFANVNADSIRLAFTATQPFHFGKVYCGNAWSVSSLRVSDPGMDTSPQRNAVIYTFPAGPIFTFNLGDTGRKLGPIMSQLDTTGVDLLNGLAELVQSFIHIDNRDRFWDVVLADKQVSTKMTSAGPYYAVTLSLQAKP